MCALLFVLHSAHLSSPAFVGLLVEQPLQNVSGDAFLGVENVVTCKLLPCEHGAKTGKLPIEQAPGDSVGFGFAVRFGAQGWLCAGI